MGENCIFVWIFSSRFQRKYLISHRKMGNLDLVRRERSRKGTTNQAADYNACGGCLAESIVIIILPKTKISQANVFEFDVAGR
jgi:hypothetical protein